MTHQFMIILCSEIAEAEGWYDPWIWNCDCDVYCWKSTACKTTKVGYCITDDIRNRRYVWVVRNNQTTSNYSVWRDCVEDNLGFSSQDCDDTYKTSRTWTTKAWSEKEHPWLDGFFCFCLRFHHPSPRVEKYVSFCLALFVSLYPKSAQFVACKSVPVNWNNEQLRISTFETYVTENGISS